MAPAKKTAKMARGRKQDRARVAGGQRYEVSYEAKKTGRSAPAVKKAVKKVGNVPWQGREEAGAQEVALSARRSFRRALRASVPDGIQNLLDLRHGGVWRETRRRMLPCDFDGMIPSVRIGPVPGPPVIFAFVDSVCFVQHPDSPSAVGPDRWSPLHLRSHRLASVRGVNP